ncbi:MAG TPA: PLP-dependent aminotransferase family protein [Thermoanaerobaculia bacterium]|nr:PLP-dependent aminotransferase family protein [Thermoanaerobaculia bacterium]
MSRRAGGALFPSLEAVAPGSTPLYLQIYQRIRKAILAGNLGPGARLPSTRTLAADLGVSRITTELAYAQLDSEGFLVRRVGAGTFVGQFQPAGRLHPRPAVAAARPGAAGNPTPGGIAGQGRVRGREEAAPARAEPRCLSRRGQTIAGAGACVEPIAVQAFNAGLPALEAFPVQTWNRLLARRCRLSGAQLLGYGEPAGFRPLREAVAEYLAAARGVACNPEQVIILTSSQQALDLAARLLLDPGDAAWLEEPGYPGARAALLAAGGRIVPVPVDERGLDVEAGRALAPAARLAYVTPSHQYPTGATMSLERRLALVRWAESAGAWVLEDDYDSEFRYSGRPLAALQGLDSSRRVIYIGTFSKVMFPSLRLAYLVTPDDLVDAFVAAVSLTVGHAPQLAQAVLADFLAQGQFSAHLRKMRALYGERRELFLRAAAAELGGRLRLGPSDAGLQVAAYLADGGADGEGDDRAVAQRGARHGLSLVPLSRYYLGDRARPGLLLGYAGLAPAAARQGLRRLARVVGAG